MSWLNRANIEIQKRNIQDIETNIAIAKKGGWYAVLTKFCFFILNQMKIG